MPNNSKLTNFLWGSGVVPLWDSSYLNNKYCNDIILNDQVFLYDGLGLSEYCWTNVLEL